MSHSGSVLSLTVAALLGGFIASGLSLLVFETKPQLVSETSANPIDPRMEGSGDSDIEEGPAPDEDTAETVIRAQRFILEDEKGATRAQLFVHDGRQRAAMLVLYDEEEQPRVGLSVERSGVSHLGLGADQPFPITMYSSPTRSRVTVEGDVVPFRLRVRDVDGRPETDVRIWQRASGPNPFWLDRVPAFEFSTEELEPTEIAIAKSEILRKAFRVIDNTIFYATGQPWFDDITPGGLVDQADSVRSALSDLMTQLDQHLPFYDSEDFGIIRAELVDQNSLILELYVNDPTQEFPNRRIVISNGGRDLEVELGESAED